MPGVIINEKFKTMTRFIYKILKFFCQVVGMVVIGLALYAGLNGDLSIPAKKVIVLVLGVIGLITWIETSVNLFKDKDEETISINEFLEEGD